MLLKSRWGKVGSLIFTLATLAGMPTAQADGPRGFERFEYRLDQLDRYLRDYPSIDILIKDWRKQNVRSLIFTIEGLARLYTIVDEEYFKGFYKKIKKLEDALGSYTEIEDYIDFAIDIRAPNDAIRKLRSISSGRKKVLADLLKKDWVESNGVTGAQEMADDLYEMDWLDTRADRKSLVRAFEVDVNKVIGKKYDMDQLQKGIHELRRRLRWFSIYFSSMDGAIGLEKQTDEAMKEKWEKAIKKFNWSGEEKPTYELNLGRHLQLVSWVEQLGVLKDQGEYVSAVALAMGSSDAKEWIYDQMKKKGIPIHRVHAEAHEIYDSLKRSNVLESLSKELSDF